MTDRFSKGAGSQQFPITTTDCSLTAAELRDAAHRRWAIVTYFKQLNASVQSERFAVHDPHAFTAIRTIECLPKELFAFSA